jgi:hypothetical protein
MFKIQMKDVKKIAPGDTVLFVDGLADVGTLLKDVTLLLAAVRLADRILAAVEVSRGADQLAESLQIVLSGTFCPRRIHNCCVQK